MAGEKRNQDQDETLLAKTVLVDIEGTTTSISFVKETLFPYIRQNLKNYIEKKWEKEEFKQDYEKLKEQAKKDEEDKLDGFVAITGDKPEEQKESLLKNILWQMDIDRKTSALKQLQGHMWREAYKTGVVKTHVYEDVPKALKSWTNDAKKLYVYSSGSIEAQKILLANSVHGNLLKYFSGFFDTEVGAKQESESYKNILSMIGEKPSNVVFLTDVVKEAAAAKEAGLSTVVVIREGNAALTDEEKITYRTIKSFLDLTFQTSTKRQKLEKADEKVDENTTDASELMDTSDDVEMTDISDKKNDEKNDVKEGIESEKTEYVKSQSSEDASTSLAQKEEPMEVEKDSSNSEKETPIAETTEPDAKSKDTNDDAGSSKNAEQIMKDDATTPVGKDNSIVIVLEKTEKIKGKITIEITPATDDTVDVSAPESVSTSENTPTTSEKKTDDSIEIGKDTQTEVVEKIKTVESDKKADDVGSQQLQTCDKNIADKPEECLTAKKDETKEEESKIVSDTSESKEVSAKSEQEEVTKTEKTASDLTENGETIEIAVETTTVPSTVTETEATTSTIDVKKESTTPTEISSEKNLETTTEPEKVEKDEKTSQEIEAEKTVATDAEKCENETTKQETTKEEETVKEENVLDTKDKNTVDLEKQKLNGTTQNGNTDVPVLDDKLHSNGLNEGSSKETTSEDAAAQNGEPESSSESSAETIKVKKVVDSTVADGAGEPDVVPPVVVAATS